MFKKLRERIALAITVLTTMAVGSMPASAQLNADAQAAFTDAGTAITDVSAAAWPVIAASLVFFYIIKLVRKAFGKA